jgi:hypothetical protein
MFGLLTASQDIPRLKDNETLIGIVATNQARKDFGQAIQVVAELRVTAKSCSGSTPTRWTGSGRFLTC